MFFLIPGKLIALATFPGVVLHEVAHRLFCDLTRTPVYDVTYFQLESPVGCVVHAAPKDLKSAFLISAGPLIVNTLICSILAFPALVLLSGEVHIASALVLFWLAISAGMHAFPSNQDLLSFQAHVRIARAGVLLASASAVFSGLIKVVNALRVVWSNFFYALAWAFIPAMIAMAALK